MFANRIRVKVYPNLDIDIAKWRKQGFTGLIIVYGFFK